MDIKSFTREELQAKFHAPIKPLRDSPVQSAMNNVRLSWPVGSGNFTLLSSTDLATPFTPFNCSASTNPASGLVELLLAPSSPQRFFILKGQ